jgi:hypothetical protein
MREISLAEYAVRNGGLRAGLRASGLIAGWVMWLKLHDEVAPTVRQLTGTSERSRRQYYRELEAFKVSFPGEESPERLARRLLKAMGAGASGDVEVVAARLLSVPASRVGLVAA